MKPLNFITAIPLNSVRLDILKYYHSGVNNKYENSQLAFFGVGIFLHDWRGLAEGLVFS